LLLLLAGGIVLAAKSQPPDFAVERSITTAAPASVVYEVMSDLGRWREWSPWEGKDPAMSVEISEPSTGEGARYAWNGDRNVGAGSMTITGLEAGRAVHLALVFTRPFKAENQVTWSVEEDGAQRCVRWRMTGRNEGLGPRIFSLVMSMDRMCGKDFEAGLRNFKALVESESSTV
jgi:hypothetical protein